MKILFVTWDGPQTSYLQSLFLPIFKELTKHGYRFSVLQFTWDNAESIHSNEMMCNDAGIDYKAINVMRKPSSAIGSFLSVINGTRHISNMVKNKNIDIVMPRSTLPALSTMLASRNVNFQLLFDADGLPLDERVDFTGANPQSIVHRIMRDIETQAVIRSRVVVTRSSIASTILQHRAGAGTSIDKFFEVANGRPQSLFKPLTEEERNKVRCEIGIDNDCPVLVYAGSLGLQYCIEEMLALYRGVRKELPKAKFLVLSGQGELLKAIAGEDTGVIYKSVDSSEVPRFLAASDIGLAIRDPSFSMRGVAPIKLGEYLMCGIPVIATKDVGDTSMINDYCGILLTDNTTNSLDAAVSKFVLGYQLGDYVPEVISKIGAKHFSLDSTVNKYLSALSIL